MTGLHILTVSDGWLALAAGLVLLGRRPPRVQPAHRRSRSHSSSPGLRTPLPPSGRAPLLAGALAALAIAVLGGTAGLVAALPSGAVLALVLRRATKAKTPPDPRSIAFVLDLIACSLSAGAPPERAIAGVADAVEQFGSPEHWAVVQPLQRVGRLLQLGTDPVQAWTALDALAGYGAVAAAGRRCASSGARLAAALSAAAEECRATQRSQAVARAERVGVLSLLPLGLCFLPAFVCIGVVPVVAGIAGDVLAGMPT